MCAFICIHIWATAYVRRSKDDLEGFGSLLYLRELDPSDIWIQGSNSDRLSGLAASPFPH